MGLEELAQALSWESAQVKLEGAVELKWVGCLHGDTDTTNSCFVRV